MTEEQKQKLKESTVEDLLRLVSAEKAHEAPTGEHPLQTEACPPLSLFPKAVREGWPSEWIAHVSNCPYCQRLIGLEWRLECPDVPTLMRYLADPEHFPFREAMEFHLNVDRCSRCHLLLQNPPAESQDR